jgi:hypothetical protein
MGPFESYTEQIDAELVLKSASGSFVPIHWLMSTLCHEVSTLHVPRVGLINIGRVFSRLARTHQGQSYPRT